MSLMRARLVPFTLLSLLLVSLCGCGYRSIQQQDEDVRTSWSQVVSQYQRRAELISGLADSLKSCASEDALIGAAEASARSGASPASPGLLNDPAAFAS